MKKSTILLFILIIISLIVIAVLYIFEARKTINTNVNGSIEPQDGMRITMIGGTNMENHGNASSCGFIIRSKNNQLIIVDGGRDIDSSIIFDYIQKYGNGVVNHWYITHPHSDHIGALLKILEEKDVVIENLYYSFNSDEWYKEFDNRGYETEHAIIENLNNKKILNTVSCQKDQIINMDNINCEIIRIANPNVTNSDNGNDSSMVFKMIATDVNKSIIFLGDAFTYTSIELMENPEKLKADAVQMAHHGQNGVSEDVYKAISPKICFFNTTKYLYDNNFNNQGYNTGNWKTIEVRKWVEDLGATSYLAFEGDQTIWFSKDGYEKINN